MGTIIAAAIPKYMYKITAEFVYINCISSSSEYDSKYDIRISNVPVTKQHNMHAFIICKHTGVNLSLRKCFLKCFISSVFILYSAFLFFFGPWFYCPESCVIPSGTSTKILVFNKSGFLFFPENMLRS